MDLNGCDIQGSHLIGYLWVSLIIDPLECLICYLFALNQPSSALNYLKTIFTFTNQNWIIFLFILLGREITFEYTQRLEILNPGNKRCYKKWNEQIFIISDCNFYNAMFPSYNFIWWLDSQRRERQRTTDRPHTRFTYDTAKCLAH